MPIARMRKDGAIRPTIDSKAWCSWLGRLAVLGLVVLFAATSRAEPVAEGAPAPQTDEERAYEAAMLEAESAYELCLRGRDASACLPQRQAYARYLPDDAEDLVLGCREERVMQPEQGRTGPQCTAYDARFHSSVPMTTATETP